MAPDRSSQRQSHIQPVSGDEDEEEDNLKRPQTQKEKEADEKGNDGSVSDNQDEDQDEDDGEDSGQELPSGGIRWPSDRSEVEVEDPSPADTNTTTQEEAGDTNTDTNTNTTTGRKRKQPEPDTSQDNHNDNGNTPPSKLNEYQRQLRNAREKRRSGKICDQFDQIRDAMVQAGVIVPKGTKGTILAAAREYIALLQEQQRRVALDNCLLVHQVQRIGEGALGAQASNAVRQVASKNGVASIVWPHSNPVVPATAANNCNKENQQAPPTTPPDYSAAFRNSPVAMAVANLGGSLLDCNNQFCQLTNSSKHQVTSQTIFTLVDQDELHNAFDRISHWLFSMTTSEGPASSNTPQQQQQPILLKSNVLNSVTERNFQLCLTPIQNQQKGGLRYLCVTLTSRPPSITTNNNSNTKQANANAMLDQPSEPLSLQNKKNDSGGQTNTYFAVG